MNLLAHSNLVVASDMLRYHESVGGVLKMKWSPPALSRGSREYVREYRDYRDYGTTSAPSSGSRYDRLYDRGPPPPPPPGTYDRSPYERTSTTYDRTRSPPPRR